MTLHSRGNDDETRIWQGRGAEGAGSPREVLIHVYHALQEKGYNPIRQIASFIVTGEPAYITAHQNARSMITKLDRDEVIEELVRYYLANQANSPTD